MYKLSRSDLKYLFSCSPEQQAMYMKMDTPALVKDEHGRIFLARLNDQSKRECVFIYGRFAMDDIQLTNAPLVFPNNTSPLGFKTKDDKHMFLTVKKAPLSTFLTEYTHIENKSAKTDLEQVHEYSSEYARNGIYLFKSIDDFCVYYIAHRDSRWPLTLFEYDSNCSNVIDDIKHVLQNELPQGIVAHKLSGRSFSKKHNLVEMVIDPADNYLKKIRRKKQLVYPITNPNSGILDLRVVISW